MFSEFTLEVSERRLARSGEPVPLAPKAFDLLVALLRRRGRLVTKSELLEQVWPDTCVEEGILSVHVSALRKALRDDGRRIETVPRAGYRLVGEVSTPGGELGTDRPFSLAVLPARPVAGTVGAAEGDWPAGLAFADTLADGLGRLAHVVIRPTGAVLAAGQPHGSPAAVGTALRVDAVLEAGVVLGEGRARITARLVRSGDGACLWQREFDEADILGLAADVAAGVAGYLGLRLSRAERREPAHPPEAYALFGRGRSHLLAASMLEVPRAVEAFRAATEAAPTYAAAHAGLALAHCAEADWRVRPHGEAYAAAREAALRALGMDDTCADAQVALGAVLFRGDWNWPGAERSFERALRLNPNHTEAYLLYGSLLEALGRLDEGLEAKLRALERDPFSPLVALQISMSHFHARRYDEAIEWARKALDADPRHPHAREFLAGAYLKKGDVDRYMEENLRHAEVHGAPAELVRALRDTYSTKGPAGIVRFALDQAARQPLAFPDFQLALLHAEAGDLDAAFLHLDRALDARDPALVHLAVAPQWDTLRRDPARFAERLARMGLPAA